MTGRGFDEVIKAEQPSPMCPMAEKFLQSAHAFSLPEKRWIAVLRFIREWAYRRDASNGGEFENETVFYHKGDLRLPAIELDFPAGAEADDLSLLILIEGNLIVDGHIYSEDTDGACGLIVLGDLTARNMVVGGQEIYVTGDLEHFQPKRYRFGVG